MGLLDRLAPFRPESRSAEQPVDPSADDVFTTKALRKFLAALTARESPVLVDLGPVVGKNVSFFGEQLGCKIFVEDLFADIDRHVREHRVDHLADFLSRRFTQADESVDGILCWDIIDYLDRASAQLLGTALTRMLRPHGALLGFFGTGQPGDSTGYTKYTVVDEGTLTHRAYAGVRGRQAILLNRDIIRLFPGLRVSDSFLLLSHLREIMFRKPG